MVLSAPPPDDAPGSHEPGWLDRLSGILGLADRGVIVLVDCAHPARLGEMVRALLRRYPNLAVHRDARRLAKTEKGSVVILCPDAAQAGWLNVERPVVSHRELRLVLFSDAATSAALAHGAVDFFHWISHRIECPEGAWLPAVRTLRGALRARARGIAWRGGGFVPAFEAALPGRPLSMISAALPYEKLVEAARPAGRGWVGFTDLDSPLRQERVVWALAEAGRRGRAALVEAQKTPWGFWPAHARPGRIGEVISALESAGATRAGRLSALLDLEPEAIDLAVALLRGGVDESAIEETAAMVVDGGAAIARLAIERRLGAIRSSPPVVRALGHVPTGRPKTDRKSIHHWFCKISSDPGAWGVLVDHALGMEEPQIAERWARRWLERGAKNPEALRFLGRALLARREYAEATRVLRESVMLYEQGTDPDPLGYSLALHNLGRALYHQGMYTDAERPVRRALHLARKAHGTKHPTSVDAMATLSDILLCAGKDAEAKHLLEQALSIRESIRGTENEASPLMLYKLGHVLAEHGLYTQAEELLRVVPTQEERSPLRPGFLRNRLQELAHTLSGQGRYAEAEALFHEVVAARKKLGKSGSLRLAHAYGEALAMQGKYAQAESVLRGGIAEVGEQKDWTFYRAALDQLGQTLVWEGRYGEAEPLLEEVRHLEADTGRKKSSPYVASTQALARIALDHHGRPAEAEALLREVLGIEEAAVGRDDPALTGILHELAEAVAEQERFVEAERILKRGLRIAESSGDGEEVGSMLALLAVIQASMNRRDAVDTARRALTALTAALGADHPRTASAALELNALIERPR